MDSTRRTALVAGVLFIITFVVSIPAALMLYTPVLDNAKYQRNAAVQALNVGGTLTDTFSVTTVDGTAQTVTVTINGTNDAAVISGTSTGSVIEAGGVANGTPGTPTSCASSSTAAPATTCPRPEELD